MSQNTRIVITAEDKTKAAINSVVGNLNGLQGALGALDGIASRLPVIGAAAAAAFGAVSFTGIIKGSIDYADSLDELSQRTGISVETLSSLRNAAELSGTSLEGVGKEVQKLTRNMAEAASGGRTQVENFETLGIAVTDASGKLRSSKDVLLDLARVVGDLEDPTERVAAAQLALGKSGGDMVPLLLELAQNGLKAAEVTTEQAEQAARLNDQLDMMRQAARDAGQAFSLELLPVLTEIIERFNNAARAGQSFSTTIGRALGLSSLKEDIRSSAAEIERVDRQLFELSQKGGSDDGRYGSRIRQLKQYRAELIDNAKVLEREAELERRIRATAAEPPVSKAGSSSLSDRLKKLSEEADRNTKGNSAAAKKQVDELLKRQQEAARQVSDILAQIESGYSPEIEQAMARQAEEQQRQADALKQQVERYQDLADPAAKFRAELQKIAEYQKAGQLSAEEADKAAAAINKQIRGLDGASDAARELGLTFSSAFEDAIVGGKKFSEVLKGLADDIVRMMVRRNITEPLSRSVGGFDLGSLFGSFGSLFGSGNSVMGVDLSSMAEDVFAGANWMPSFDVGTPYVPQDMVAKIHKGERILTADENRAFSAGGGGTTITYAPVIQIDSRSDRQAVMADVDRAIKQGNAELVDRLQRSNRI